MNSAVEIQTTLIQWFSLCMEIQKEKMHGYYRACTSFQTIGLRVGQFFNHFGMEK